MIARISAIVVLVYATSTFSTFAAPIRKPLPEHVQRNLDFLWADLESADEFIAGRALLEFAEGGDDAVEYLGGKLRPLRLSEQRARHLVAQLGSDDEQKAKAAFAELRYFDPRLAFDRKELESVLLDCSAPRRLGALLCALPMDALSEGDWHWNCPGENFRFTHGNAEWRPPITVAGISIHRHNSSWVRAVRAVVVLEQIHSRDAMSIVKDMATGHSDAAPTKAAKAALDKK